MRDGYFFEAQRKAFIRRRIGAGRTALNTQSPSSIVGNGPGKSLLQWLA